MKTIFTDEALLADKLMELGYLPVFPLKEKGRMATVDNPERKDAMYEMVNNSDGSITLRIYNFKTNEAVKVSTAKGHKKGRGRIRQERSHDRHKEI